MGGADAICAVFILRLAVCFDAATKYDYGGDCIGSVIVSAVRNILHLGKEFFRHGAIK